MKKYIIYLLVAFPAIVAAKDDAQIPERKIEAVNNFSSEASMCSAFFTIVAGSMQKKLDTNKDLSDEERTKTLNIYNKYMAYTDKTIALVSSLNLIDRNKEMAIAVTLARYDLEYNSMVKEINYNLNNISILLSKHLTFCIDLVNNPEKRLKYWVEK